MEFFPLKEFYFVRHGQTDMNLYGHAYTGAEDVPLNNTGITQAQSIRPLLEKIPFTNILSSPLLRAIQTAEIMNEDLNKPLEVYDNLREFQTQTCYENDLKNNEHFLTENNHIYITRILQTMLTILESYEQPLIVSHSGVFQVISQFLSTPFLPLPNCAIIQFFPSQELNKPWIAKQV